MARLTSYILFAVLAICWAVSPVHAQTDTASYQLKAVEIFGKPAEVFAVGSKVTSLDSSYLHAYASASLAEALQARTPIYFKSYGVSGISTVSFRGTNASQTAVIWNGLNISSPALGQSDFATLPLSGLGDVAVQYGAASANYGSGAIGGAILLNSPAYTKKGLGIELQQEAGSFGRYFSSGTLSYSNSRFQVGASAYLRTAENDFKYRDLSTFGAPERRQEHASNQAYGFTQDITWHFSPNTSIAFHNWYTFADRELQPAMGSAHNKAKLQDDNYRFMTELNHRSKWGKTEIKAAFFDDYLKYTDVSINSVSDIQTYQLQAEHTYTPGNSWSLRGGVNLQQFIAENDNYAKRQKENRASLFALLRYDPLQTLQLSLNIRQALAENYNPLPTPSIGVNWNFYTNDIHQLYLKGNVSGSYRIPTLNDLYWAGAGNPDLKPEQGWNYEGGLRHTFSAGNSVSLESEATAYTMLIDNWIQWAPNATGSWRPTNLLKVRSEGVELNTKLTTTVSQFKFTTAAGYSFTSSEQVKSYSNEGEIGKQLMYVPLHKAVLSMDTNYKGWLLLGSLNYTGLRFTTNSETTSLDSFLLLNLALSKSIKFQKYAITMAIRSDNVSDTEYQTMQYRAMPLRNYTFSLQLNIP